MSRRDRDAARAPETDTPAADPAQQLDLESGSAGSDDEAAGDDASSPAPAPAPSLDAGPPPTDDGPGSEDGNAPPATESAPVPTTTWLTTRTDETYGGAGRFVELTAEELAAAPEGLFVEPTPEQLALRPRS